MSIQSNCNYLLLLKLFILINEIVCLKEEEKTFATLHITVDREVLR